MLTKLNHFKRLRNISQKIRLQIAAEYQECQNGVFRYRLQDIADRYEVSLSTVHNIARMAHCQGRPQGGRRHTVPSARDMKVLRDATIPGIGLREVGEMNGRWALDRRTKKMKRTPLSRQRVHQIIQAWTGRGFKVPAVRGRGFKPGQKIEWKKHVFTVLRYDDARKGAAISDEDNSLYDPFFWTYEGCKARLVPDSVAAEPQMA
jgi:hypothetical protein